MVIPKAVKDATVKVRVKDMTAEQYKDYILAKRREMLIERIKGARRRVIEINPYIDLDFTLGVGDIIDVDKLYLITLKCESIEHLAKNNSKKIVLKTLE